MIGNAASVQEGGVEIAADAAFVCEELREQFDGDGGFAVFG
jgi:hypothetical protein